MDSIYVVMPAYNEEENIRKTVKQWYPVLDGKAETSRLIIADSGSSDRTHELLTEMKKEFPKLEILSETNRYHGSHFINMRSKMERIIFFRLTRTGRPIQMSLTRSGKPEKNMTVFLETE